ncbi:hypothetical protein GYMLUDRAFT_263228 [Collybiopsis luxurians FD-317 M1]|uniref:Uncharacterized protein n=1 Tax=Collybiopsis luxurians FD-317 M1 TaxID=944289 RepID=A0A0D0B1V8_9AGAR|nr:hypothetical protein GYMLUDRAFT_263228 [Collybiopsis luxurians FD-317 M1]
MNSFIAALLWLLVTSLAQLQLVSTSPIPTLSSRKELIAWSPTITYPNERTVLKAGYGTYMSWKTDDMPEESKNSTGYIMLGWINGTDTNEHLDWRHPVASNFKYTDGKVNFTLPENLEPRDDYIFVLMGDSGNASPTFTILQFNSTNSPSAGEA